MRLRGGPLSQRQEPLYFIANSVMQRRIELLFSSLLFQGPIRGGARGFARRGQLRGGIPFYIISMASGVIEEQ